MNDALRTSTPTVEADPVRDANSHWADGRTTYQDALGAADAVTEALRRADTARLKYDQAVTQIARGAVPLWPLELALRAWENRNPYGVASRFHDSSTLSVSRSWPHSQWRDILAAVRDLSPENELEAP